MTDTLTAAVMDFQERTGNSVTVQPDPKYPRLVRLLIAGTPVTQGWVTQTRAADILATMEGV